MPQCVLAYNPAAGRYPSRILTERAAKVLREYGWQTQIEPPHCCRHISELALLSAIEKKDFFFVVGVVSVIQIYNILDYLCVLLFFFLIINIKYI